MARYKAVVGKRIQSATLVADAHHSWLDALSSRALVGLAAVALGYRWGDPVAGFAVTLFILHVGYEVTTELVHHLMDGLDPEVLDEAERAALMVGGVWGAAARGRWTGRTLVVEIEGGLDPAMSLAEAAETGEAVEEAVRGAVAEVRQVRFNPRPVTVGPSRAQGAAEKVAS